MNWTSAFLLSSYPLPPKKQYEENKNLTTAKLFSYYLRMYFLGLEFMYLLSTRYNYGIYNFQRKTEALGDRDNCSLS